MAASSIFPARRGPGLLEWVRDELPAATASRYFVE